MEAFFEWCEEYTSVLLRFSLGFVFLWLGVVKLMDTSLFGVLAENLPFVTASNVGTFLIVGGIIQILIAVLFFLGLFTRWVALGAGVWSLFSIYHFFAFSIFQASGFPFLNLAGAYLLKDLIIIAACLVLASSDTKVFSLDKVFS